MGTNYAPLVADLFYTTKNRVSTIYVLSKIYWKYLKN